MKPIYFTLIMAILTLASAVSVLVYTKSKPPQEQPQISPCECLTYYQWTYWSTKRDRVLNKRKRTRTDSLELRNADRILGLDNYQEQPQNLYPPR